MEKFFVTLYQERFQKFFFKIEILIIYWFTITLTIK